MGTLISKALVLVRSRTQQSVRRKTAAASGLRPSVDVSQFELPPCAPGLEAATRDQLLEWYWRSHPRFGFFKGAPSNACVLDLGAGGGALPFWREYLDPRRADLRLFGTDLKEPVTRSLYEDFQIADLDAAFPFPDSEFDIVIASHILEHLKDPAQILAAIAVRLTAGGRAYVEMPSPASKRLPTADAYRAKGWPMMISNFHDDATHRDTMDLEALSAIASGAGLNCLQRGYVSMPYLEDTLLAQGHAWKDSEILLYGFWSKTKWAQFAVFERLDPSRVGGSRANRDR